MSQAVSSATDNAAAIQDLYAAFRRGDVAAILAKLASDVEWRFEGPAAVSLTGVRRGVQQVKGFFDAIGADHADPKLEIAEVVTNGDAVAAFGRYQVTIKATGKRVDTPIAHLWKLRGGKIVSYTGFADTAAFAAALN